MIRSMSVERKRSSAAKYSFNSRPSTSSIAMNHDAGVLAAVVDRDDVRMTEPAGRLRLAAKARDHVVGVLAAELVGADRLQRDDGA